MRVEAQPADGGEVVFFDPHHGLVSNQGGAVKRYFVPNDGSEHDCRARCRSLYDGSDALGGRPRFAAGAEASGFSEAFCPGFLPKPIFFAISRRISE